MGIFQRATEIISANLNDAVDHFERPDRMLRQALREMEALLATTSAAVAKSIAAERLLSNACEQERRQVELWNDRAKSAVAAGDEPRARRALARQLHHQRSQDALCRQLAAAQESNAQLRHHLDGLRDKYVTAKGKLTAMEASHAAAAARSEFGGTLAGMTNSHRAVARFEHFYGKLQFAEAEYVASLELAAEDALELEFSEDESAAAIEKELAVLRGD